MVRTNCFTWMVLAAVGCSAGSGPLPESHDWEKVEVSSEDQKGDPLKAVPKLIDQRETPGNLDRAIAILRWHSERQPQSAELHQMLAEAHSRAAEMRDLKKDGDPPYHAYHRTEGLRHADLAVKLAPNAAASHYWRGTNLLHTAEAESSLGRAKEALKELDRAEQLSPQIDDGGPARLRGKVLHDMPALVGGSVPKAIESYKKSLQVAPNNITTHLWLGEAYLSAKKQDLARKELEWVLSAKGRPGHEKEDGEDKQKAQDLLKKLEAK